MQHIRHALTYSQYTLTLLLSICLIHPPMVWAQTTADSPDTPAATETVNSDVDAINPWGDLSLGRLFDLEVESASKRSEPLFDAPAAISVITSDDIARSGMREIPEILRLAPGLHVTRQDTNVWRISARGFNGRFNRLQLVQIDGRSVYSPFFSGVFWENQDMVVEDIEQIEVIRGPGGSLWGANALNGIINIKSKHSSNTQGWLVNATVGTDYDHASTVRWGHQLKDTSFRIYAKETHHDTFDTEDSGLNYVNDYERWQTGFRTDTFLSPNDELTIQGDVFRFNADQPYRAPNSFGIGVLNLSDLAVRSGWNLLSRWTHDFEDDHTVKLQGYISEDSIDNYVGGFQNNSRVYNLDLQHNIDWKIHTFVWGVGLNINRERSGNGSPSLSVSPDTDNKHTLSAFIQDTINLWDDKVAWTIGSKFEKNDTTGSEWQPNTRVMYKPNKQHRIWAALTRAVRVPTRADQHLSFHITQLPPPPFSTGNTLDFTGLEEINSETLIATEIGYRFAHAKGWQVDISAFRNSYAEITTITPIPGNADGDLIFDNGGRSKVYGIESTFSYPISTQWDVSANHTMIQQQNDDNIGQEGEHLTPKHQIGFRQGFIIDHQWSLSNHIFFTDTTQQNRSNTHDVIAAYTRLDLGVQYKPHPNWEIGLWGQNLLKPEHYEAVPDRYVSFGNAQIPRTVLLSVTGTF